MSDNPYVVIGSPSYAAPIIDLFGANKPQSGTQQTQQINQQKPAGQTFVAALQDFINGSNGQQMLSKGSAIPGASGPTSVGGAPLVASSGAGAPMINSQGMGYY